MTRLSLFLTLLVAGTAHAGTVTLKPATVTEWKAVYGRVEARNTVPARARLGGIIVELRVSEGDDVTAGQTIAVIRDDKLAFQVAAQDAQLAALQSQLDNANTELERGKTLVAKGVLTPQRLDQLQTVVDVVGNQMMATRAQRAVVVQQQSEGDVLAPADGKVLSAPVTRGAVVMGGEAVVVIGGGGFFLRLSIPERHARFLKTGAAIRINSDGVQSQGRLAKIYPQIANGRVVADVEVDNLDTEFVNARVLVELPVGERQALIVPEKAVATRSGIDFVTISQDGKTVERSVVLGERITTDGQAEIEILTGLAAGDMVVVP